MNHVLLTGRLVKDPELKYSQTGKAFSKFTIAVNREFNREEVDFINCTAWENTAERIAEYLKKGRKIVLHGRLRVNSYEQDGETRWSTEVAVDRFEFADKINSKSEKNFQNESENYVNDSSFADNEDEILSDEDFPF